MTKLARNRPRHSRACGPRPGGHASLAIRSAERRRWSADLTGPGTAGLVLYGIGGIGKSTLAAQIAARLARLQPDLVAVTVNGEVSPATLTAARRDAGLIVLDDFDDNLIRRPDGWVVADPALEVLLATWTGKLLFTSRIPFALPGRRLSVRRLGPLTRCGASELASSLPALRLLGAAERDQAWRLTSGHPLALEYLDALLAAGEPYGMLAARIAAAVEAGSGRPVPRIEPTELPAPTAELVTSAAGDQMFAELFGRLGTGARALLIRASVFRQPVRPEVVGGRPGQVADCRAVRLMSEGPCDELFVHRWTADQLHRHLVRAQLAAQLADAHRQAAGYWRSVPSQRAGLETRHHREQERHLGREPAGVAHHGRYPLRNRLLRLGVASAVTALAAFLATAATRSPPPHRPAAIHGAPRVAVLTEAAAVRDRAAAWVADQVSAGAILACDPAMCAALSRRGIPAGDMLVLGPAASDPLGSDVVLETAALRAQFGNRLAGVYAPLILASFGTGQARIAVRAVAPDGTAACLVALAADLRARRSVGRELLRDPRLEFTSPASAQLAAGRADARLLITLAAMAASQPLRVLGFGDAGPGASPGLPSRAAQLEVPAAVAQRLLAFLRAQRPPYLAARADIAPGPGGRSLLTIEFAAPSPLGLLRPR